VTLQKSRFVINKNQKAKTSGVDLMKKVKVNQSGSKIVTDI
jgi:hypothetical protein